MSGENSEKGIPCPFCKKHLERNFSKGSQGKIASKVISLINEKRGWTLTITNYRFCKSCNKTFVVSVEEERVLIFQMIIKGGKIFIREMRPYYLKTKREREINFLRRLFKGFARRSLAKHY